MKKTLSVLLALSVVLAVTACAAYMPTSTAEPPEEQAAATVDIPEEEVLFPPAGMPDTVEGVIRPHDHWPGAVAEVRPFTPAELMERFGIVETEGILTPPGPFVVVIEPPITENIPSLAGIWRRDNPGSVWHNIVVSVYAGGTAGFIVDTAGAPISDERLGDIKWRNIERVSENLFALLDYGIMAEGGAWFDMIARIDPANPNAMYLNRPDGKVTAFPGYTQRWVRVGG